MNIGARLKEVREAIGYKGKQVAILTGISCTRLSRYENNVCEPKFSTLVKLADIYKKQIEFFLGDKPLEKSTITRCEEIKGII